MVTADYVKACGGDTAAWGRRWATVDADPDVVAWLDRPRRGGRGFGAADATRAAPRALVTAVLVIAAVVGAAVAIRDLFTPTVSTQNCPARVGDAAFDAEVRGRPANVRSGASLDLPVVARISASCKVDFSGYCIGDEVMDAGGRCTGCSMVHTG